MAAHLEMFSKRVSRRQQKFSKLHKSAEDFSPLDSSKTTGRSLTFALALQTLPIKDVICGVELAIWELPLAEVEEIRGQTCQILKTALPLQQNKEHCRSSTKIRNWFY